MSLDFQQVQEQVRQMGENAPEREQRLREKQRRARELLSSHAQELESLNRRVQQAVEHDPNLRCALPLTEALNAHFPLPALPSQATLIAADGSQINPDRHAAVHYCLINVGAICMRLGTAEPPKPSIHSELLYDEKLYTNTGTLTEGLVALMRDLNERQFLFELADKAEPPIVTFTDGPMELWGAKEEDSGAQFQKSLKAYLGTLSKLRDRGVVTAGYVDKPGADMVVRLLEVASVHENELDKIRQTRPLRGVTDIQLYEDLLPMGERSAVFAIQSNSAKNYKGDLALRFFYLNVGQPGDPWLARVEIPAWVANDPQKLDNLHAVLIQQCQVLGTQSYPYLLHRAHETAVVSMQEKDQVTQMILVEMRRRGVHVGSESHKQIAKRLSRRKHS